MSTELQTLAVADPEATAVVGDAQVCTRGELDRRVDLLAARLGDAGVAPGARVAG